MEQILASQAYSMCLGFYICQVGLTIVNKRKARHQRGCDWEQNSVSGIFCVIRPPQHFQHGLDSVGDVVLVIWGMALQLFMAC